MRFPLVILVKNVKKVSRCHNFDQNPRYQDQIPTTRLRQARFERQEKGQIPTDAQNSKPQTEVFDYLENNLLSRVGEDRGEGEVLIAHSPPPSPSPIAGEGIIFSSVSGDETIMTRILDLTSGVWRDGVACLRRC